MASIIAWITPIPTNSSRSLILRKLTYSNGLSLIVEDEQSCLWNIHFQSAIGFRRIVEDLSTLQSEAISNAMLEAAMQGLPTTGGLFEVIDSEWIKAFGPNPLIDLSNVRLWIVECYDDFIEVLARKYTITQEPFSNE